MQRTCSVDGCGRPREGRTLCSMHYQRERRAGKPGASTCEWPDCTAARIARGFCYTHYARARKADNFNNPWVGWVDTRRSEPTPCRWPDCTERARGHGLCTNHYAQARNLGDFSTPWLAWEKSCEVCGATFKAITLGRKYCSTKCNKAAWKARNPERARESYRIHVSNRRARLAGVKAEPYTITEIAARDGYRCGLCHRKVRMDLDWPHPRSASIDHIFPLSHGGDDLKVNVQLSCLRCNHSKNNRVEYGQPLLFG